jgi:hypothetical protein
MCLHFKKTTPAKGAAIDPASENFEGARLAPIDPAKVNAGRTNNGMGGLIAGAV